MKKKILIVVSDYYKEISNGLIEGAKKNIELYNQKFEIELDIVFSPGSFEIPFLINKNKNNYDGFIALGCIIRGETYHFDVICNEVTRKIMDLSINLNKPIGFGVLTCENLEQAKLRSSTIFDQNKGFESAKACLKILFDG
tara:strand:- start:588 stop:1010 length:423 start_codon:yes stop_codon:yes gene_type:complete